MTNFEFCRDSIHSKTTDSCILLLLCTLGFDYWFHFRQNGKSFRVFGTARLRSTVDLRWKLVRTCWCPRSACGHLDLGPCPVQSPVMLYQEYIRTRVGNSILWGLSRQNSKFVIDDAQPLSFQVVMHSTLNTCMLARSRSSIFLTGISGQACTLHFFFFLFTQARPQSQRGELWGCLVVGLDTLGRPVPVVSASSCV